MTLSPTPPVHAVKWLQMMILGLAALGGALYGYDIGIISGALLFIHKDIPMTGLQESIFVASVLGGGAIATLVTGFLCDCFGRRRLIQVAAFIFVLSVLVIYTSHSYLQMLSGRLIQGVAVGIVTIAVPLFLTESMPPAWRGRGVTAFQLMLTLGIFLASLVGLSLTPSENWRGMFLSAMVPGVLMLVGSLFLPESPRWYAMKGRFEEAAAVLSKVQSQTDADLELKKMKEITASASSAQVSESLWQRRYLKPLFLVFGIAILMQLTGINVILQFSTVIFKAAGASSNTSAMLSTNAIMGLNFIMTCVAIFLVDILERRTLVAIGLTGLSLSLAFCGLVELMGLDPVQKSTYLLYGILGFIGFFAVGPGAAVWVLLSELLPLRIRSNGVAAALFLNSMASTLFAASFATLAEKIHFSGIFFFSATCGFLFLLLCLTQIPKTKGQSLEDIEHHFEGK